MCYISTAENCCVDYRSYKIGFSICSISMRGFDYSLKIARTYFFYLSQITSDFRCYKAVIAVNGGFFDKRLKDTIIIFSKHDYFEPCQYLEYISILNIKATHLRS